MDTPTDEQDKKKNGSVPLPSILSNIRNAGRSSNMYQKNEVQPLMVDSGAETSSPPPSHSNTIRRNKSMTQLFERVQAMEVYQKGRQRIRRLGQRNRARGFQVDLPPKFLVYTIMVFIILPLLLGSFFLARTILFEGLKEDASHPLHKKQPHWPTNSTKHNRGVNHTDLNIVLNGTRNDLDTEKNLNAIPGNVDIGDQLNGEIEKKDAEKVIVSTNEDLEDADKELSQ